MAPSTRPLIPGTGANPAVSTITLQLDGKIIIGGSFTTYNGVAGNRIARLNPNGSIDTTFRNPCTGANVDVTATAVQGDGKIVFGGNFSELQRSGPKWHRARIGRSLCYLEGR